jgi:hypothetical protein
MIDRKKISGRASIETTTAVIRNTFSIQIRSSPSMFRSEPLFLLDPVQPSFPAIADRSGVIYSHFASKQIANLNVGESAESPPDDGVASGA